jgi:hypothetical protein
MRSLVVMFLVASMMTSALAQAPAGWTADAKTGCRIWNDDPEPGETVSWSGGCQNGLAQGFGTLQWFKNGKKTELYVGELRNGKQNGRGAYTWTSGNRYDGEWRDGEAHGRGVLTWPNGRRFEGEWRNDKPNGQGKFKAADSTTYTGTWTNGCLKQGNLTVTVNATAKECGGP